MRSRYHFSIFARIKRRFSGTFRVYDRALKITREGWFLVGFIFAVGIAAINTGNNLLYLVLAVMLGTVVASGVLSEESVRRVWLERTLPTEVWAGEQFQIYYSVTNRRRRLTAYGLRIEESRIKAARKAFIMQVPPGGRAVEVGAYKAEKRGVLTLDEVKVSTKFPFGFFDKIRLIKLPARVIVFPRPAKVDEQTVSGAEKGTADNFGARGEGPDLFTLRPYVEGDSLRSIHWKATARTDSLVSKETRAENLPTLSVILDTTGYARPRDDDALENAISLAAGYVKKFIEDDYLVRLITPAGEAPFGTGATHLRRIMTRLALFEPPAQPRRLPAMRPDENKIVIALKTVSKPTILQADAQREKVSL